MLYVKRLLQINIYHNFSCLFVCCSWMTVLYAESIGKMKGSSKDHVMSLSLMNQAHQALRFQDLSLTLILLRPIIHMRSSTTIITARCLSKSNSHSPELKYSKPLKNMIILLCKATPNSLSWTLVSWRHCSLIISLHTVLGMNLEVRV